MFGQRVIAELRACADAGHRLTPVFIADEMVPLDVTCQTCGKTTDHPQMLALVRRLGRNEAWIEWPISVVR